MTREEYYALAFKDGKLLKMYKKLCEDFAPIYKDYLDKRLEEMVKELKEREYLTEGK